MGGGCAHVPGQALACAGGSACALPGASPGSQSVPCRYSPNVPWLDGPHTRMRFCRLRPGPLRRVIGGVEGGAQMDGPQPDHGRPDPCLPPPPPRRPLQGPHARPPPLSPRHITRLSHKPAQAYVNQAAALSTVRACRSSPSKPSLPFMEGIDLPPGRIMRPVRRTGVRRRVPIPRKHRNATRFGSTRKSHILQGECAEMSIFFATGRYTLALNSTGHVRPAPAAPLPGPHTHPRGREVGVEHALAMRLVPRHPDPRVPFVRDAREERPEQSPAAREVVRTQKATQVPPFRNLREPRRHRPRKDRVQAAPHLAVRMAGLVEGLPHNDVSGANGHRRCGFSGFRFPAAISRGRR